LHVERRFIILPMKNNRMNIRTHFLLPFLLICSLPGFAQIQSDRPGQAFSAYTPGKLFLQLQTGVDYSFTLSPKPTIGPRIRISSFKSTTILRLGLGSRFEVNVQPDVQWDRTRINDSTRIRQSGLSNSVVGARANLINRSSGWITGLAVMARTGIPINSQPYTTQNFAPEITLMTQHPLPADMSLSTNLSTSWDGNSSDPKLGYVVNIGFPMGGKWSGFAENFGNLQGGTFSTYVDGGIAFTPTDNLQLDFYGGMGNNNDVLVSFLSLGASWRIATRKND
jgi:hypothetical protein